MKTALATFVAYVIIAGGAMALSIYLLYTYIGGAT